MYEAVEWSGILGFRQNTHTHGYTQKKACAAFNEIGVLKACCCDSKSEPKGKCSAGDQNIYKMRP